MSYNLLKLCTQSYQFNNDSLIFKSQENMVSTQLDPPLYFQVYLLLCWLFIAWQQKCTAWHYFSCNKMIKIVFDTISQYTCSDTYLVNDIIRKCRLLNRKNDGLHRVTSFKVCINHTKLPRNDIRKKCVKELKLS